MNRWRTAKRITGGSKPAPIGSSRTRPCSRIARIARHRPTGCVDGTRHYVSGPKAGTTEQHRRYFITSLKARVAPFAHAVRSHWQIENACHWTLDVVIDEDQNRAQRDAGPKNLATLRRWALSLMRQDTTQTTGLKGRRLMAGWDPDYLLHLLRIAVPDTDTNS